MTKDKSKKTKPEFFEEFDEDGENKRILKGWNLKLVGGVAIAWTLFQLWYASPFPFIFNFGQFIDVPARAIHLAFAFTLCFLLYPSIKSKRNQKIQIIDFVFAFLGLVTTLYLVFGYEGLVHRQGLMSTVTILGFTIPYEIIIGSTGIILLLEATRRVVGLPLVIIAVVFILYSFFGRILPDLIAHPGLSLNRLVGYHWLGGEAIFGIPISVSVGFIFLFVLFGSVLDAAGGGKYFLNLAFASVGRMRGGPAKAAILASGLTGMISGSSVANTVTTGAFTIPIMKKTGLSAVKAGAIEVAASVNGQLMPPIMGAAAFIMAELLGISYLQVVTHAILPAIISYIALFYISHLESVKLGIKGLPEKDIPPLGKTFIEGIHYLIPIAVLVYLLLINNWTASSAVFYSITSLLVVIIVKNLWSAAQGDLTIIDSLKLSFNQIMIGFEKGAINMVSVGVAIATAGIIVGAVSSTGLSNNLIMVVETIAGSNVIILLGLTAVLCILLGMGLPTTANYLVVAALMANVVVEVGNASGYIFPLIAVHLYVFYFGLMADITPPVGLASYAAAAISRADPIQTGIQAFWYSLRTAILPIVFIFNHELLLIGIEDWIHALVVISTSLIAILVFTAATQRWFMTQMRWYEVTAFLIIAMSLFRPGFILDQFYPEYNTKTLSSENIRLVTFKPDETVRIKITRQSNYGKRYKLFEIPENKFNKDFQIKDLGIEVSDKEGKLVIEFLQWNAVATQVGLVVGDTIDEFKTVNPDRPNKAIIYPFALLLLLIFGYSNFRRSKIA
jgi:TRAP transporter 4TM/12TM fusion protein